ncbi:family 16 glycoside hydrolase [Candidatus Soleaferrea massiliensis]|uniref:family 16 glycoside hydrolase n=1 Tax=Candidatus Soleaferrea massiliensis TaxID=1470354 RepID=UPI000694395D|nr:family 16 glycoside hydrolase [Candidatus Soleaferrea massiliensis]
MKKRLTRLLCGVLASACVLSGFSAGSFALAQTPPQKAYSDEVVPIDWDSMDTAPLTDELSRDTAQILLNSNKYAVTSWYNDIKKFASQTGEYLTFGGTGENNIRPVSHEAMALATSLRLNVYDPEYTGVSAEKAEEITLRLIGSLAYRHKSNSSGGWGDAWQSAFWASQVAQAGWMMWDKLSEQDREYVKNMTVYESNRFISYDVPYYKDREGKVNYAGDSKAEENSWNANILQFATAMMPNHENYDKWVSKMVELEISAFAAPDDMDSREVVNGMQLNRVLNGSNMELDGTVINHDIVHADYMVAIMQNYMNAWAYGYAGREIPMAARFNGDRLYYALTDLYFSPDQYQKPGGTFYTRNEDGSASHRMYYPQGNDWGGQRQANYQLMDIVAYVFGEDANCSTKAIEFAKARSQEMLRMQARSEDGRYYQASNEDTFYSREEWVACHIAYSYTALWMKENDMYRFTNEPLAQNTGTLTSVKLSVTDSVLNGGTARAGVSVNKEVQLYMNDQNSSVVYQSGNDNILSVDQDGVVTANFPGETTLTVTVSFGGVTLSDTKTVTVEPRRELREIESNDYESGQLPNGWRAEMQMSAPSAGNWTIKDDGEGKVLNQSLCANNNNNVAFLRSNRVSGDLQMSTRFRMNAHNGSYGAGMMFRYQDNGNYYVACYYNKVLKIEKRIGGNYSTVVSKNMTLKDGQWYELGLTVKGKQMTVTLDGVEQFTASDNLFPSGKVGVYTMRCDADFDDFSLSASTRKQEIVKEALDFEDQQFPADWEPTLMIGNPSAGNWSIVDDGGNHVLKQSQGAAENANVACIRQGVLRGDLDISARFKMHAQASNLSGAGIMFRYQDPSNYYVVSYYSNLLKIEKRVNGQFTNLVTKNTTLDLNKWYTLGVTVTGNTIRLLLDGKEIVSATDKNLFPEGKTGVFTTRTATSFDDIQIYTAYDIPTLKGDVNGDETLGVQDLLLMKSQILGRTDFVDDQKLAADVNADGIINIFDLVALKFEILRG